MVLMQTMPENGEQRLQLWKDQIAAFTFPRWQELPEIDLYMDQVVGYLSQKLAVFDNQDDDRRSITATMINNYVKNKVLFPPVKKKYSRDHMMLLLMIYYMKSFLSIVDIRTIISPIMDHYAVPPADSSARKKETVDKKTHPRDLRIRDIYEEVVSEVERELPFIRDDDFLGVQNYTRTQYGPEGQLPCPEGAELTQMDYEFYPEALEHVIRKVHEDFKGDLIVTENGTAVSDDSRRVEFIRRALEGVQNCIRDGIPVKGYCYWSLMDNFEWQKGFSMTFGLVEVNRQTMQRTSR